MQHWNFDTGGTQPLVEQVELSCGQRACRGSGGPHPAQVVGSPQLSCSCCLHGRGHLSCPSCPNCPSCSSSSARSLATATAVTSGTGCEANALAARRLSPQFEHTAPIAARGAAGRADPRGAAKGDPRGADAPLGEAKTMVLREPSLGEPAPGLGAVDGSADAGLLEDRGDRAEAEALAVLTGASPASFGALALDERSALFSVSLRSVVADSAERGIDTCNTVSAFCQLAVSDSQYRGLLGSQRRPSTQ